MSRWIALDGPVNVRDLGGIEVARGTIRAHRVIRGDAPTDLSQSDRARLHSLGITDVVDLRTDGETAGGVSELVADGATHHHLPVGMRLGAVARMGTTLPMADVYLRMLEASGATVVRALGVMAAAGGAVVVHCAGGKDRTGIVIAALLDVLGASDADIVADYAATAGRMPLVVERLAASETYADLLDSVDTATLEADPATMGRFLAMVRARHGSMRAFLDAHGLDNDTVLALTRRLVET